MSSYRLKIVTMNVSICSGLAAIMNANLLPAAITVLYRNVDCTFNITA